MSKIRFWSNTRQCWAIEDRDYKLSDNPQMSVEPTVPQEPSLKEKINSNLAKTGDWMGRTPEEVEAAHAVSYVNHDVTTESVVERIISTADNALASQNDLIAHMKTEIATLRQQLSQAQRARDGATRQLERYGSIEEKAHLQTIDERDAAEQALSQAYFLIKGESPEWSNLFGYDEALEVIDDAQKCLRSEIKSLEAKLAALSVGEGEFEAWWKEYGERRYISPAKHIAKDAWLAAVSSKIL